MKKFIIIILVFTNFIAFTQDDSHKLDFRIGGGVSLIGGGDYHTNMYENELNYHLNPYFTISSSINFGKSKYKRTFGNASFYEGNINVFVSPFKNTNKLDFRIGGGFSVIDLSRGSKFMELCWGDGVDVPCEFTYETLVGYNVIIESSYLLKNHILVGGKIFTQIYTTDMNTGILLKVGYQF